MAVNKFTGAISNNVNVNGNWSLGIVPTAVDGNVATWDGTSPNCILNATFACNAADFTGYTGILSGASSFRVDGNLTFSATMTITANGPMQFGANGTWTSNGIAWPGSYTPTVGSTTITLADNATIGGSFTHTAGGGLQTFNGNTLNVKGSWTQSAGRTVAGTTLINFNGTAGTSTLNAGASVSNSVTFATSNTISMTGWNQAGGTLTYTSGTISGAGGLTLSGACTINTSGMTWPGTITLVNAGVVTLTSNLSTASILNGGLSGTATINGAFNINCTGINTTANCSVTGTASIVVSGTGTLQNASASGNFQVNITINGAGTSTIGTNLRFSGATLTWVAGTVDSSTNSSTLTLSGSSTINTAGMSWYNVTITGTTTTTINSLLTIANTLTFSTSVAKAFAGTAGWTAANVVCAITATASTITFKALNTYTTTTSLAINGLSTATRLTFVSDSGGTQFNFVLNPGATQTVSHVTVTDANNSTGQTIWCFDLSQSNTLNWNSLTPSAMQTAYSWVG